MTKHLTHSRNSRPTAGVPEHEGQLEETARGRAGGEDDAAGDGGGLLWCVPIAVVEKSDHRLRHLLGGGVHPHLWISVQVSQQFRELVGYRRTSSRLRYSSCRYNERQLIDVTVVRRVRPRAERSCDCEGHRRWKRAGRTLFCN